MAARRNSVVVNKIPFLVLEIIGFALSAYLFMISAELIGGKIPCPRSKWIACESAVKGYFSHIGPFSVAAMGVIYYIIHLTLTSGLRDRWAQILKVLFVAGGLFFVAWLRALEIVWLKKICPWCWGVAALTLIHAGLTYYLAVPPLKRLRVPTLAALIFFGFLLLVGVVTTLELGVQTGKMMMNQGHSKPTANTAVREPEPEPEPEAEEPKEEPVKPKPKPEPTKASAAVVMPTSTPRSTPVPQTPEPIATPSPTPKPQAALPAEPEVMDSPDVQVLKAQGWRHAGSGEDVIRYIKARPPVLMLAYDPFCPTCHDLITTVLNQSEIAQLRVTRLAIQESMLTGQVSGMIKEMPTLILFGPDGSALFTHTGLISVRDLSAAIQKALAQ